MSRLDITAEDTKTMECLICKSNTGEQRISPGPTIFEGEYWFVEHAYPVKTIGWLVIVLKRHAEALHELTTEEFAELGKIQAKFTRLLYEELQCEKEYISCYAEMEHFCHIHVHVFAKPSDLPDELRGGHSFALLKVTADEAVSSSEIIAFCIKLQRRFKLSSRDIGQEILEDIHEIRAHKAGKKNLLTRKLK